MCGKEYPVVNTEAVCLFSPTDFLWGPSQELVLESRRLLLPPRFSANTHLTSYILWLTISESCWTVTVPGLTFFLIPSAWPTYIKRIDFECHSETFRMRLKDLGHVQLWSSFLLRLPVAYSLPYLTVLTPTNQLFRKHTLIPRTDHKKNNNSGWIVCRFHSVIRAIWVDYWATQVLNDFFAR